MMRPRLHYGGCIIPHPGCPCMPCVLTDGCVLAASHTTACIVERTPAVSQSQSLPDRIDEGVMMVGAYDLLRGMGVDVKNDPNFKDTPSRVARMFREMLTPEPNTWATFPAQSADLVLLRGHRVVAICPHHLQPVELKCYIGYIPNKLTVGLSKLARVVEEQLTRPLMQEELAHQVAERLCEKLDPKGVGVVLAGVHGCMRFRGVESHGDVVTSVMKGVLLLNPAARQEFLQLIGTP